VEIGGNYGQIIWSYTVNGGSTQDLNQPFYGALLTLRWDLFSGFDRYYGISFCSHLSVFSLSADKRVGGQVGSTDVFYAPQPQVVR